MGFLGTTLIAPPIAPSPYMTEAAPRSTSMRSTDQVSNGKVTVPAPANSRVPSNSCITEPWPEKPRAAIEVLPLPGEGAPVMPVARVAASMTETSPRARMVSPVSTSMLAGVSSGVRPRRLPVCVGSASDSAVWAPASTCTGGRLGAACCAKLLPAPKARPMAADMPPRRRAAGRPRWRCGRRPAAPVRSPDGDA